MSFQKGLAARPRPALFGRGAWLSAYSGRLGFSLLAKARGERACSFSFLCSAGEDTSHACSQLANASAGVASRLVGSSKILLSTSVYHIRDNDIDLWNRIKTLHQLKKKPEGLFLRVSFLT